MLLGAVTVVLLVAGTETEDAATRAMTQALRASLASDAVVMVQSASRDVRASNDALSVVAEREHASLVTAVDWGDHHRRATVHFLRTADQRLGTREIVFDGTDATRERGRAVGFAIASMVTEEEPPPEPPPSLPAPAPPPPIVTSPVPPSPPSDAPRTPSPTPTPTMALEVSAIAATAFEGFGGGGGVALAFRRQIVGGLAFRVAAAGRFGEVEAASASTRTGVGALGLGMLFWTDRQRRWAIGGRMDGLVVWQEVVHLSADDEAPVHASRFVPGADAALEGTYRFTSAAAFVVGLGVEATFGETDVYVHRRLVATLAPLRGIGELGLRLSF